MRFIAGGPISYKAVYIYNGNEINNGIVLQMCKIKNLLPYLPCSFPIMDYKGLF